MDSKITEMFNQIMLEIREMRMEQKEMRTDVQHLGSQINSLEKRVIDLGDTLKVVNYKVADIEIDVGKLKLKQQ